MNAGGPMLCKSNRQSTVTKSSEEAELIALCEGVVLLLACRNFNLKTSSVYE